MLKIDLKAFYKHRIEDAVLVINKCRKIEKRLSIARLSIFIIALVVFYLCFSINIYLAFAILALFILSFIFVVKADAQNISKKNFYSSIREINENELKSLDGEFDLNYDGKEYYDKSHPYAADLDVFGKFSVFQYINRTSLKISRDIFASWLKSPASTDEIVLRQQAVKELNPNIELRQKLFAYGIKNKAEADNHENILHWLAEPSRLLKKKTLLLVCTLLPILTICSFVFLNIAVFLMFFTIQIILIIFNNKEIRIIHDKLSRNINLLNAYSETILLLENESFTSVKLNSLLHNFKSDKIKASLIIKSLSKILNMLDLRLNIIPHAVLNTFFFWDIHQVIRLEKWKKEYAENVEKWFNSIGEFEALSSFANLSFNNPGWVFPTIFENHFNLKAKNLGHPLIFERQRVCNDIEISGSAKLLLVSGSNMSGKSTFLRTMGVNIVLAMAGSSVTASEFLISPVKVLSSIRNVDSLEENTSTFYAEIKKLDFIIKSVEQKEKVFILLDEIFKGTNSYDKHIGSVALIKKLIDEKSVGIIASHDIELSKLSDEIPLKIENYNFDVHIKNDELFFDYKLNKGVCKSRNVSILLKKIGINI